MLYLFVNTLGLIIKGGFMAENKALMTGKTVVITGASSGIGLEAALGLAKLGARVVMVSREKQRGLEAVEYVKTNSGNKAVDLLLTDLSSLKNVRKLASDIKKKYKKLDVLLNNAGGVFGKRALTPDGFEWTFALDHLAPFLLTNLLLPLLKKSGNSRVVTVASMAHMMGHINFDDLMAEKKYAEMGAYSQAKLANVLFASELARRLKGTKVTSNSLHPGVVHTKFAQSGGALSGFFYNVFGFLMETPAQGARTSIYAASSPEMEGVTGKYLSACKITNPTAEARDEAVAKRLWDVSAKLVGLK
jgi:NAD(P)-dependent dehydrogenase (short-subunit alcohol dehydrogenase family)